MITCHSWRSRSANLLACADGNTLAMYSGVYRDLKTLRGASKRVRKAFPLWREIEVRFEPFTSGN